MRSGGGLPYSEENRTEETKNKMKYKLHAIFPIFLAVVGFAALAFVILPPILYGTNKSVETPDPNQVVQDFYTWYISYEGNPLADKAYQSSQALSPEFIARLDEFSQSGGWVYDPILCAQDVPTQVTTFLAQVSGGQALVGAATNFVDHKFVVELIKTDNRWVIHNVLCDQ